MYNILREGKWKYWKSGDYEIYYSNVDYIRIFPDMPTFIFIAFFSTPASHICCGCVTAADP